MTPSAVLLTTPITPIMPSHVVVHYHNRIMMKILPYMYLEMFKQNLYQKEVTIPLLIISNRYDLLLHFNCFSIVATECSTEFYITANYSEESLPAFAICVHMIMIVVHMACRLSSTQHVLFTTLYRYAYGFRSV